MAGVMGLGYDSLSGVWLNHTVFSTFVSSGLIEDKFGMCVSTQGGVLTFGGFDSTLYHGQVQYTNIIQKQWYVIRAVDMGLSGDSFGLSSSTYNRIGGGTILDSGTNTLVIAGEAYNILQDQFCKKYPKLPGACGPTSLFDGNCYDISFDVIDQYPTVYITLDGTGQLEIRGRDYLIPHREKNGKFCLGIQSSGIGGFTILGNVFQHRFYVMFDRNNSRLGFAEANNDCVQQ